MNGREYCLSQAGKCVLTDRSKTYGGSPEDNFSEIAVLWSNYLDKEISTADVSIMMILLKIARLKTGEFHVDSWIDIAGYSACGLECAGKNNGVTKFGDNQNE